MRNICTNITYTSVINHNNKKHFFIMQYEILIASASSSSSYTNMSSACSDNTDWAKPFESLLQVASCSSDSNGMAWSVFLLSSCGLQCRSSLHWKRLCWFLNFCLIPKLLPEYLLDWIPSSSNMTKSCVSYIFFSFSEVNNKNHVVEAVCLWYRVEIISRVNL